MARFSLTTLARLDLFEIEEFISRDSPASAERVIEELFEAMTRLADAPRMGHTRRDVAGSDVRFWIVRTYLIAYRPRTRPIQIVRVISGSRDLTGIIRPP